MTRHRVALLLLLVAAATAVPAAAQETDGLSKSESDEARQSGSGSDCICPKEGHWEMPNFEGTFKCGAAAILNRKLKKLTKWGTTVMMKEDCSVIFGDGTKKKEEQGFLSLLEGCGYAGVIEGEDQGVKVVFDVVWDTHSPEFITGEMFGTLTHTAITCEIFRPFEMKWVRPLSEKEYQREMKEGAKLAEEIRKKEQKN